MPPGNRYGRSSAMEYFIGLITSIAILVIETTILVFNMDIIKVYSINEFFHNSLKLAIVCTYIVTLFIIPAIISWSTDAAKSIASIYKRYAIMSLASVNEESIRKKVSITFVLISVSLLLMMLSIVYRKFLLSLTSLIPLTLFVFMLLKPIFDVKQHSKRIDAEIKWFMMLLLIVEYVKCGIDFITKKLDKSKLLKAISRELNVIKRDEMIYFQSYVEALIQRAKITPNESLRRLLLGYAMRLREGGDTVSWLKTVLGEELIRWEWETKIYSERVTFMLLQIAIAIFVLIPTLVVAIPLINPFTAILLMIIATPVLSIVAYITRPKTLDKINVFDVLNPLIILVLASSLLFTFFSFHGIVMGWIIATIASLNTNRIVKEIRILDEESLEILKIVAELRKHGYEIPKALKIIAQSSTVNAKTSRLLEHVLSLVETGHEFSEAIATLSSPSFQFNFIIFLLGVMYESGGGDEEAIQMIYEYLYRYRAYEENIKKASRIFELFTFVNLGIILWIWRGLKQLYSSSLYQFIGVASITSGAVAIMIIVALIGYSITSSIIRYGIPVLETAKSISMALIALVIASLL